MEAAGMHTLFSWRAGLRVRIRSKSKSTYEYE